MLDGDHDRRRNLAVQSLGRQMLEDLGEGLPIALLLVDLTDHGRCTVRGPPGVEAERLAALLLARCQPLG